MFQYISAYLRIFHGSLILTLDAVLGDQLWTRA